MVWLYWLLWVTLGLYLIIGLIAALWTARVDVEPAALFVNVVFAWLKMIGRFLMFFFGWPVFAWLMLNSSPQ